MADLGLHCQQFIPGWAEGFYRKSGSKWAKTMSIGDEPPIPSLPDISWIFRFYEDEAVAKDEVLQGQKGAILRLNRCAPEFKRRPWLSESRYYVEHMNEPTNAGILAAQWSRIALDEHTAEYTRILFEEFGIRSVGYNLGVGHPELAHVTQLFGKGFPALIRYEGLWSMHAYGWPSMATSEEWYALRYRKVVDTCKEKNIPVPRLALTECGIDRLIISENGGWQVVNNSGHWYVHQELMPFHNKISQDSYVVCADIFTSTPEETWVKYELREGDAEILAEALSGST